MSVSHSRRSVLAVPGSSEKMIGKSLDFQVDQLFLDLEDAVAPGVKALARDLIANTFDMLERDRREFVAGIVSIRINGATTPWIYDDLSLLASGCGSKINSVIFPKSASLEELKWLDSELSKVEKSCGIALGSIAVDAQIESAQGVVHVEEIACAPRVTSIAFGPADFMADLGMPSPVVTSQPAGYEIADAFHYPMMRILIAARAAGIAAIDGPILEVHSLEKFRESALRACALGFDGKWVLHPSQIDACNEIFTPSQEVFDNAALILEAYDFYTSGIGGSKGAVVYNDAMIDEASRKMAQATFLRGVSSGLKPGKKFIP